ncbi:hypothetical protein HYC85_030055 [Camellia sinensis]|uniref:Uncharacterized protein n=1 Tax=Camellia sinensis TaxID=4442 RepID=A0A7J7G3H2_CAMSI|nr:hypothetical protein HYC85_030055 [Camellia sinensis]
MRSTLMGRKRGEVGSVAALAPGVLDDVPAKGVAAMGLGRGGGIVVTTLTSGALELAAPLGPALLFRLNVLRGCSRPQGHHRRLCPPPGHEVRKGFLGLLPRRLEITSCNLDLSVIRVLSDKGLSHLIPLLGSGQAHWPQNVREQSKMDHGVSGPVETVDLWHLEPVRQHHGHIGNPDSVPKATCPSSPKLPRLGNLGTIGEGHFVSTPARPVKDRPLLTMISIFETIVCSYSAYRMQDDDVPRNACTRARKPRQCKSDANDMKMATWTYTNMREPQPHSHKMPMVENEVPRNTYTRARKPRQCKGNANDMKT